MNKKLINLSNLQKFLLKLNEKFALKKTMKGISEDSEGNIIIGEEGLVPTPDENSKGKFLRSDGAWSVPGDSPLYETMSQEEGIEGVSEVDRVINAKTLKAVIDGNENVLHKSGDETITGLKTFERNGIFIDTKNSNVYLGCNLTSNEHQGINFLDKNGEQTGLIANYHYVGGTNGIELVARGKYKDGKPDPAGEEVKTSFRVGVNNKGEKYMYTSASWGCDFIPREDNTYTLGSPSFKWKSIYGNLVGNADSSTMLTTQTNSTMPTDTTALPRVGMYHQKVYKDGYPIDYGNLINVQSKDVGGSGQLLLGWSGTNGANANIYYRNKRDVADAKWSEWKQLAYVEDLESKCKCLPLKGGTLTGKLTLKQTSLAMSVKDTNSETIRTHDVLLAKSSNSEYGLNVGLGGLGNTVVGAGESLIAQLNELEGNNQENLFLTADNSIYFKLGANTVFENAKTVSLSATAEMSGLSKVTSTSFVGALTGNADTSTQFSANKSVTLTGDVTGTASSKGGWSVATTLAKSGVTAGTYGPSANVTGNNNATISVPQITVDAKGRVTSVVNRTLTCKNNTYTIPTKVSQLTNDNKYVSLTALGSGNSNGMQATEAGSIMLCTCNCSVLESTSSSIQSNRSLQVPGSYLMPISWMEISGGHLQRTAPEDSNYNLTGTWRLLGNFQPSSLTSKSYYVGLFMRVI